MNRSVVLFLLSVTGVLSLEASSPSEDSIDTQNYVLGTQTIGIRYQFTEKTGLVETAERIHGMGSNLLKIALNTKYSGADYSLPKRDDIKSLEPESSRVAPSFSTGSSIAMRTRMARTRAFGLSMTKTRSSPFITLCRTTTEV